MKTLEFCETAMGWLQPNLPLRWWPLPPCPVLNDHWTHDAFSPWFSRAFGSTVQDSKFRPRSNVVKARALLGHVSVRWPQLLLCLVWEEYERSSKFAIQPIHPCHNDASMEIVQMLQRQMLQTQLRPEVQATQATLLRKPNQAWRNMLTYVTFAIHCYKPYLSVCFDVCCWFLNLIQQRFLFTDALPSLKQPLEKLRFCVPICACGALDSSCATFLFLGHLRIEPSKKMETDRQESSPVITWFIIVYSSLFVWR